MEEKNLSKVYNPKQVEDKWYRIWEENKYFHANVDLDKPAFTIVMPPPNVTGTLHLGHALDNTLQDILTRWRRMQGYNTLWVPGTDHAGIATQAKVEEQLAQEGKSKYDLGREGFLARTWQWKHQYGSIITEQLRKLGTSCDWDRERFTMDEGCSQAVRKVFVDLFKKGLIYRDNYIINWCPKCQTTISDIEVEHVDSLGQLYHLRYPTEDGLDFIEVATTRPETMLGDTAVAVHPDDQRYTKLIGKKVVLPILNRLIPIIADKYVDSSFGTGAVKITPAHDPNDFEIGKRHNLAEISVLDKKGLMNNEAGPYQGLERNECRRQIVQDLKEQGFLVRIEEHDHAVGHCYRCDTIIEPMVSKQWFVKMQPLAEPAILAAQQKKVRFVPERFTKVYLDWMTNIRDWCISRQLWWGHRIPVWYCGECQKVICSLEDPTECPQCFSTNLVQDPDVLDTWFSSALWPFSTLGWPEKTNELTRYYPTSVLVTGRDIIFFWVARMIFQGIESMGEVPFSEVFIHGLVLDAQGRKMSKSLGNGVDPLEVIQEFGADTLRFMLITGNTPGNDLRFQFERLEATRNFTNKIWNATRFVLMNLESAQPDEAWSGELSLADQWILSRFHRLIQRTTDLLEKYELGEAARELYEFIWNEFCDWYIELIKPRLYGQEGQIEKKQAEEVIVQVLRGSMELLHPFMPFITEEIWQHLPHDGQSIMLTDWPQSDPELIDLEIEEKMSLIMDIIRAIRNLRSELNVPLGKKAEVVLVTNHKQAYLTLKDAQEYIKSLAAVDELKLEINLSVRPEQAITQVVHGVEVFLPLKDLIDLDKEILRLEKEIMKIDLEIARLEKKLNNEGFLAKAPEDIIAKERAKQLEYEKNKEVFKARLACFQ